MKVIIGGRIFFPVRRYVDVESVAMISWNVLGAFHNCSRGNKLSLISRISLD